MSCLVQNRPRKDAIRIQQRQRGAVIVEATLVVPVLITLFFGCIYLGSLARGKQQALNQARTCAWLYSNGACKDDVALPDYCRREKHQSLDWVEERRQAQREASDVPQGGGEKGDAVRGLLRQDPADVFTENGTARSSVPIGTHRLFNKIDARVSASYHLPCNLRDEGSRSKATQAWELIKSN